MKLLCDGFMIWKVSWSFKDQFWIIIIFGGCCGLTTVTLEDFGGLRRADFGLFSLWKGMVVLKLLILQHHHVSSDTNSGNDAYKDSMILVDNWLIWPVCQLTLYVGKWYH